MTSASIRDPVADHLISPQNAAFIVIDYQHNQFGSVRSMDSALLLENVVSTAKLAKLFGLPIVHSTVGVAAGQDQSTLPELANLLEDYPPIDRTTINSWEDAVHPIGDATPLCLVPADHWSGRCAGSAYLSPRVQDSSPVDPLSTDRLDLKPLGLQHCDDLVALDSDPEVMRYINGGRPSTPAEVEAVVRRSIGHRWAAVERATGGFVGWFALDQGRGDGLELGYRIVRPAWGRGLATEGSLGLIAIAFSALGATRVWAQTMAVNQRSRRVLERCGLRHVGTLHLVWDDPIQGAELGEVEYELLRQDWHGDQTT